MRDYFGYTRVSTAKQGEGVSLSEQKQSISRYADREGLRVVEWFEERETAAKRGRPVWSAMLQRLRRGETRGVVIHKIDRSARNLKDWADLGELLDKGLEVHFAHESMDLGSRGGRLAADIQAVVAADYVRNLREETLKGFYGRLKQGIYPLPAPIGYLDQGAGKAKTIDPERGPLVKRAFELYSTGDWSLETLAEELRRRGLRTTRRTAVTKNMLARALRNPFYTGIIYIRKRGETFEGAHEALVSRGLFEDVQAVLDGKMPRKIVKHSFLLRRLIKCALCGRTLVGELQKGRVYYRCHGKNCPMTTIREDRAVGALRKVLSRIALEEDEMEFARELLDEREEADGAGQAKMLEGMKLSLAKISERLDKLTDVYLDREIGRDAYQERRERLLVERRDLRDRMRRLEENPGEPYQRVRRALELSETALLSFEVAEDDEKREQVKIMSSNLTASPEGLSVELREPFVFFSEHYHVPDGAPCRGELRTIVQEMPGVARTAVASFVERLMTWSQAENGETIELFG